MTGAQRRSDPAALRAMPVMTTTVTKALSGAANAGEPSGTCLSISKMIGITVTGISMITVPAAGVRIRRSSDRWDDRMNWKNDDTSTRVASIAGPPWTSAVTQTAIKAPEVPMRSTWPAPKRPTRPEGDWPGLDLGFGAAFWALLPAFVFVTLVGAIETVGDAVAIQRVSWRGTRAVDFRVVEGAVGADGVGNLLSGLAGTVPNTTYSTSISVTELTGVASRSVGIAIGVVFSALAFLPKALAVILAIPAPVVAAYATVLLAMLFVVGMKVVLHEELDYRTGLVVGVSFWAGVGFQNGAVFPEYFAEFAGGLLQNGMTAGGLVAILMTLFVELTAPRPSRIEVEFGVDALPKIREFLAGFASRGGWDKAMADRLDAAGEETLLTLMRQDEAGQGRERRRLRLTARKEGGGALLEFIAAAGTDNIQDRIALLGTGPVEAPNERELSLRLLRHIASRVHHQQYHDTDIVTVHVDAPSASRKES